MSRIQSKTPLGRTAPAPRLRPRSGGVGAPSPRAPWLGVLLTAALALMASGAQAQTLGPATHVEFDLTQREKTGGTEPIYTDSDPGRDGGGALITTGSTSGVHGDQSVSVEALVTSNDDGHVRLSVEAEHAFNLTGTSLASEVWLEGDSRMLARASLVDELTFSGVPGTAATVELYFQIRGMADAQLILGPPYSDLTYQMATQAELSISTQSPHSGGGTHDSSLVWPGGYRFSNLDEQKFADEYVMLSIDIDPSEPVPVDIAFEIEPNTNVRNFVEAGSLLAIGLHRASYWDNAAELLGVVVKDDQGVVVPQAGIVSDQGYTYPVEQEPPLPQPPETVILSPLSVADSDLGEYDATVPYTQMLDQSGLVVPFTSGQTGFDVHFSQVDADRTSGNYVNNWQSLVSFDLPMEGYIDFDLGSVHPIDRIALWNVSLEDIRVLVSEDSAGPWTEVGQFTLPSHLNFFSYDVDILDLGGFHDARYVRIQVDSAHLISSSFTYAIVGEMAVSASPVPVPEPGAVAMLFAGSAALLGAARRHRSLTLGSKRTA